MALLHADVVLVGGSGFIGRSLASILISRGQSVRVITRNREQAKELWLLPRIEIVQASPHDEADLYNAFENADAVVNLVGVLHSKPGKPWGPDFDAAHVKLPARIARCMNRRKIRRLIHISALGAADRHPRCTCAQRPLVKPPYGRIRILMSRSCGPLSSSGRMISL